MIDAKMNWNPQVESIKGKTKINKKRFSTYSKHKPTEPIVKKLSPWISPSYRHVQDPTKIQ